LRQARESLLCCANANQVTRVVQRSQFAASFNASHYFVINQNRCMETFATMYDAVTNSGYLSQQTTGGQCTGNRFHGFSVAATIQGFGELFAAGLVGDTSIVQAQALSQTAHQRFLRVNRLQGKFQRRTATVDY
jgi:hypothetical protein